MRYPKDFHFDYLPTFNVAATAPRVAVLGILRGSDFLNGAADQRRHDFEVIAPIVNATPGILDPKYQEYPNNPRLRQEDTRGITF